MTYFVSISHIEKASVSSTHYQSVIYHLKPTTKVLGKLVNHGSQAHIGAGTSEKLSKAHAGIFYDIHFRPLRSRYDLEAYLAT